MTFFSGWIQIIVILGAIGALSGAMFVKLTRNLVNRYLVQIEPHARYWFIVGLIMLPLVLSMGVLWVAFYPSLFDISGLGSDHCGVHCHQNFHLCFVHFSSPQLGWYWSALVIFLVTLLLNSVRRDIQNLWYTRRWLKNLFSLARYESLTNTYSVATRHIFAVTAGFVRPQIVHSEHLREVLSSSQFDAVLAHERMHQKRWDALAKFILRLCSILHFPSVRTQLLRDLNVACEQICDEAAAKHVGDRLTVAEAILAVERVKSQERFVVPEGVPSLGEHGVEQRIESLLNERWYPIHVRRALAFLAIFTTVLVLQMHDLHHALEHSLGWYFSLH